MSKLAKFWDEIKTLPKDEQSERIREEFGNNPEILGMLKQILDNKDDNQDVLKRIYEAWRSKGQVSTLPRNRIET